MKKWTTALLVLMMIFSIVACGKENTENGEEVSADATIEETTDNSTEEVVTNETDVVESTMPPTEAPTETPTEAPTSEPTEAPTSEPTEAPTETPTSEPTGVVEEESTSEAKPSVAPEPTPLPASGGNGGGANYSGNTITTGSGFTFPVLENFNSSGMNTNNSWAGPWGEADATMQTMLDTLDAFGVHHGGASNDFFMPDDNTFQWYNNSMTGFPDLELEKLGDCYRLTINGPMLDVVAAQSIGWTGVNENIQAHAREALLVMLSLVSSTPQSLSDAILQTVYTAPAGQELIDTNGNWTSIGDCRIKLGGYDFENGNHVVVFRIAP